MITLPRVLARHYRAVLRRALMADEPRGPWPAVLCRADGDGLVLESCRGEVAVRFIQRGAAAPETLVFPGRLLTDIESRADTPVALETAGPGQGRASWTERGVPRVVDFEAAAPESVPAFPTMPERLWPQPPEFLRALAEASASAARASVRFAVSRIQLRGRAGELVGTDGKQLLLQGGFRFAWTDDILIPALPAFGAPELPADTPLELGRTDSHLVLRVGAWTLALAVDTQGRFPKAESVIPRLAAVKTRLRLDAADAAFLADALPRLPGGSDDHAPVSLELGSRPAVRAWSADGGPLMEVTLARSSASGPLACVRTDRQYLRRALRLGFTELQVTDAAAPVCCRDRHRCFVWVPLDSSADPAPAGAEIVRLSTTDTEVGPSPVTPHRRRAPMNTRPSSNGDNHHDQPGAAEAPPPAAAGLADVLTEAEALRDLLHDAAGRASRLLAALKLQRRQTKAVQQAMASLQQLQLGR